MEQLDRWVTIAAAIAGALIGGGVAGFFAMKAVKKTHQNTMELEKEKEKSTIQALLQAIHDELETLWNSYQETMGSELERHPENKALFLVYPITQDYFPVYHGNTNLIGRIEDKHLRKAIISLYTFAAGLIDSYKFNNEMVERLIHWVYIDFEPKNEAHREKTVEHIKVMADFANKIKRQHNEFKIKTDELLRKLREVAF